MPGPLTQSAASAAYKRFAQQNLVMGSNSFRSHVENQKGPLRAKARGESKGYADNPYNNRCDELAVGEWQRLKCRAP